MVDASINRLFGFILYVLKKPQIYLPGWTTTSLFDKTTDRSGALGRESRMDILTWRRSAAEINPGANSNRMAARMYGDGFIVGFR